MASMAMMGRKKNVTQSRNLQRAIREAFAYRDASEHAWATKIVHANPNMTSPQLANIVATVTGMDDRQARSAVASARKVANG